MEPREQVFGSPGAVLLAGVRACYTQSVSQRFLNATTHVMYHEVGGYECLP